MSQPAADPARRSRLLALKLAALVRDHAGEADIEPGVWPGGAALRRGTAAWVLAEDAPHRALGPALAWARQQGAPELHVAASAATGVLARRAAYFAAPRPEVWHVEDRTLLPAIAAPFEPDAAPPAEHEQFVELIESTGAVVVRERGVLTGEVAGLEVCRAVTDRELGSTRLEVGVGAHDREAFLLIHGDIPTRDSLARIVDAVTQHRSIGADPHPLNRLASERLLRHRLTQRPALVGAGSLAPAAPPVARENVKDPIPCVAVGHGPDGSPLVVVCSVGIDLDLVPFAADAHAFLGIAGARLVLAVPERDVAAVTAALLARLQEPAELVGIPAIA